MDSGPSWPSPCGRAARVQNRFLRFCRTHEHLLGCYSLSRRAPSTTRPLLHSGRKGTGGCPSYQIGRGVLPPNAREPWGPAQRHPAAEA